MAPSAGRVAAFASVALVASFVLQAIFIPGLHNPLEVAGAVHEEGRRPSAIAFVNVAPGDEVHAAEGLTSASGAIQLVVVDARLAQAARDGAAVPSYVKSGTQGYVEFTVPLAGPSTVAFVWRATADLDAQQQDFFRRMAEGVESGSCCLMGNTGTEASAVVVLLSGWAAIALAVVAAVASWRWWRGEARHQAPPGKAADLGDLLEAAQRTQGYVARLRRLAGWLRASLAVLSVLLLLLWVAAAWRTLPYHWDFIVLGVCAALGAAIFPLVALTHRHRALRREEARLDALAAHPPV